MKSSTVLRGLVEAPEILVIPGVGDAMGARLAQQAGFEAVFLSGYATSASMLGAPDVGLLTATEMVECARRIVDAVGIPVFADGDNGHGNALNVGRTMRSFERAGVAAIFFEDQVSPKRCGHMAGKQVISTGAMVSKIQAAVDARVDPDLMIMARTDALSVNGMEDAIERMHRYLEAGADWAFVESPSTVEELRRVTREIHAPQMANMVPGGKTPILPAADLQAMGFALVAYPTLLTYVTARAGQRALTELRGSGTAAGITDAMGFEEFNEVIGLAELRAREARYQGC